MIPRNQNPQVLFVDSQHHPMQTAWASNGFDSVFAPAGAIGVREENCVLGPSRIRILGLAFGYRSPCHYGMVCSKLGSRSCSFDHAWRGVRFRRRRCGCCLCRCYSKTEAEAKESVSTAEWPSQTAVLAAPTARPGEHMMVSAVLFSFCFAPRARHSLRAMSRWSIGVANMSQ